MACGTGVRQPTDHLCQPGHTRRHGHRLPHPAPARRSAGRRPHGRAAGKVAAREPDRHRTPRILEETVRLRDCPGPVRQIAGRDIGHERPTPLITNRFDAAPRELIDRYARRMSIENTIADAIDFFHMDALSAVMTMKVDGGVQLTVMASTLYRLLARRIGNRSENQRPAHTFRKFFNDDAAVDIAESEIVVSHGRRACNPFL